MATTDSSHAATLTCSPTATPWYTRVGACFSTSIVITRNCGFLSTTVPFAKHPNRRLKSRASGTTTWEEGIASIQNLFRFVKTDPKPVWYQSSYFNSLISYTEAEDITLDGARTTAAPESTPLPRR
jgi:hypothetical protein